MANGATDLGNGLGYIYQVKPDGTTIIAAINNNSNGERTAKLLAAQSYSISMNKRAVGTIVLGSVVGEGNVTAVTIGGVNQINANIPYVVGPLATIATNIAAGINNFTPGSGPDYIAVAQGATVYIYAPVNQGSAVNGLIISFATTGGLNSSTTTFTFGSNASSIFDEVSGYRFFINANYNGTAPVNSLTNAVEITDYITPRALNTSFDTQSKTIASGIINITRKSCLTHIIVDTQGGAGTDDLDSINLADGAENDILVLWGANSARVTTFTSSGNINLVNAFATADLDTAIVLRYNSGSFYEVSRSGNNFVPSVAAFRAANYPFLSTGAQARTTLVASNNTTVTLTVNSSKKYEIVSGSVTLSSGNYEIILSTTGALPGDVFNIQYDATVVIGSFNVIIQGYSLTAEEALYGGLTFPFVFDGTNWDNSGRSYDISTYPIQTANIGNGQVTTAKLATNLKYEVLTFPVSFESGEQAMNKITIPYAGTVSEIYAISTKAIAGTDVATITPKNNAGTTMTSGTITFAISDPINTAYTATPSANNTFVAGDVLQFVSAKTTAGGKALVTVKVTRS